MNQTATRFLTRCFTPDETIAFLLRREDDAATTQRVVSLETALAPRYLAWLARENYNGANVYVAANPLRARSRKRTKESIASVRHLYIDIDTDGDARLAALRASDAAPTPTAIPSTCTRQISSALARRRLRLWHNKGSDAQTARHRLRRRSSLHRLQSRYPRPGFPQSEIRSGARCHGGISLRFGLESG